MTLTRPHPRRRGSLARLLLLLSLALALLPGATTAQAASAARAPSPASYCGITWGSLPKVAGTLSPGTYVTNVRSGQDGCWDRLVVDLRGTLKGYDVRYVSVVRSEGSGVPVPVRGGAAIAVVVKAASYDASGHLTYNPPNPRELTTVTGYQTFRQVAWAGTFEGQTTLALGVRARLPMRAFILAGPGTGSRLVVDVAHYW